MSPTAKLFTETNLFLFSLSSRYSHVLVVAVWGGPYMCDLIEETKQESTTDDDDDIVMGSQVSLRATKQDPTPRKGKQLEDYTSKLPNLASRLRRVSINI